MNVFRFILQNHDQVLELTLEHLRLVGFSTLLAMLIGIPLGIVIAHRPRFNKPVLASANIIQTIPICAFWIPATRAVAGRARRSTCEFSYAAHSLRLAAVVRNTYTGIRGVDASVVEAGKGMGLTISASVSGGVATRGERDSFRRASGRL